MSFWAYILHCNAGVFYTGQTDNLERRVADHRAGRFEGFTKEYLPVELVWSQEFVTRDEAKAAEKQIKGWSRKKKLALIRGDWEAVSFYARSKGSPSTGSGQTELVLEENIVPVLIKQSKLAHPAECCGLLLGDDQSIQAIQPTKNVHPDPQTHFEIDPAALIAAHKAERGGGPRIAGYYHSHPQGPALPSETDSAMAGGDGKIWAIVGGGKVGFFRDSLDGFERLSYSIFES